MLWEVLLRCRFNLINGQFSNCSKILLLGGLFSCISWKKSPNVSFCFGYESDIARKHSNRFNYPLILSKVSRGGWMDTKIFVAGKIARSWVILTQYQSVDGLFAVKVLVDVWGPKLFADVTVIQTFKGGGGQQFGGKKVTHQHSGAEREKNVFLSMKLDTLNVDVGHLFCFGEQIN